MLLTKISSDIKEAMRAHDAVRLSTLRMLKTAIDYYAIEKKLTLGDDAGSDLAVIAMVQKQIKQHHDSIESFEKGGRNELVAKEKAELAFLESYLPAPLSDAELSALVSEAMILLGARSKADMGKVMKEVMARAGGRADGKRINVFVASKLT